MKILHLLYAGETGGIEKLCRDIGIRSDKDDNYFFFVHTGGDIYREMSDRGLYTELAGLENNEILKLYRLICQRCNSLEIDWLVVHHPAPLIWLAVLLYLGRKNRAKVAVYIHSTWEAIVKGKFSKKVVFRLLLKKCDGIIAISRFARDMVLKNTHISNEKITVIYNGVSVQEYEAERAERFVLPVRLIYVGRLVKEKGVQILLQALTLIRQKEAYSLQIVGDGDYRAELEKLTEELNLKNIVTFIGTQLDVSGYLKNSDVFVHSPILEEGFGIAIVEAMSAKLVCVAFQKGAVPEIIEDGYSGYIVKECTAEALARKLEEVRKSLMEDNLMEMRKAAEQRAGEFSMKSATNQLHQFYSGKTCDRTCSIRDKYREE